MTFSVRDIAYKEREKREGSNNLSRLKGVE